MANTILITHDPAIDSEILKDRIRSLGRNYNFFSNSWLVETELSAKGVYDKLIVGEFEQSSILIVQIETGIHEYWGRMNPSLWEWIEEKKSKV